MKFLTENIDKNFQAPEIDLDVFQEFGKRITDGDYFSFLTGISNGGFFFGQSLQLYSVAKVPAFQSISYVNNIFQYEYKEIVENMTFFGQDIFGNQFGFAPQGVVFFNIETGVTDFLAKSFNEWVNVIMGDLEYLTGRAFLTQWKQNKELLFDQRLCAKKPFVVGGEYKLENLYAQYFPTYISSNASIARQIYNLPEGTEIKLTIKE